MKCAESVFAKSKNCNDIFWLCLFIVFWICMAIIAILSIINGNYIAEMNGFDSFGNICGFKHNKRFKNISLSGTDTSAKPYVFYFSPKHLENVVKICTEKCPKSNLNLYKHWKQTQSHWCRYDFDVNYLSNNYLFDYFSEFGPCPMTLFELQYVTIKQICIPSREEHPLMGFYEAINSRNDAAQSFFLNIYMGWHYIAALSGFAFVISLMLLIIMRFYPMNSPWLICDLTLAACTGLSITLWCFHVTIERKSLTFKESLLEFLLNNEVTFLSALFSSIITQILIIAIVFVRKNIAITAILFEEASNCRTKLDKLTKVPLIVLFTLFAFFLFWNYVMLCMVTVSHPQIVPLNFSAIYSNWKATNFDHSLLTYEKVEYVKTTNFRECFWIYIVGFIVTIEFIIACGQFTIGASVAHWYFKSPLDFRTVPAAGILLKHHLGTVTKGSLLITPFKFPRLILTYLCSKLNNLGCKQSSIFKWCSHLFGSLESLTRILNEKAYVVAARENIDFISAGRKAQKAMIGAEDLENVNNIGNFVLFCGKIFVASVTCLVGIVSARVGEDLIFFMGPVLFSTLSAFFVADIVFSLVETTMDALVFCACDDNQNYGRGLRSKLSRFFVVNETGPSGSEAF